MCYYSSTSKLNKERITYIKKNLGGSYRPFFKHISSTRTGKTREKTLASLNNELEYQNFMNKKPESMIYEQWTKEKRKRRLLKRQEKEEAKIDRAIKGHTPFIIELNPLFRSLPSRLFFCSPLKYRLYII